MNSSLSTYTWPLAIAFTAVLALGWQQAPVAAGTEAAEPVIAAAHQGTKAGLVLAGTASSDRAATDIDIQFDDPKALTKQFIAYNRSIRLTPEQERIKAAALSSMPAPCCSEFSLATCCCPCNLAKSAWGLAKHLIAERGYGVEQVKEAERRWIAAVNPGGFTGNVCATGGCNRSFENNGCGGMNEQHIR
jgi:hypothetical protein